MKNNIMSTVLGLVVGLVIGFIFANNFNRSAGDRPAAPSVAANSETKKQDLPANHPPVGTTSEPDKASGPRPEVMAAIDKAKAQPKDYEAQMTAADLYYQIQRFDDAAQFYEAAAKLKPGETEPMIKGGNAYFDAEKYEQAQKWYEMALQKEPKNVNVRTDLGLSFFLREPRDIERAIKEYKRSLEIDPDHEVTLQNLALAYSESGDKQNFQTTFEKLRRINPTNPVITKSQEP
jgi:tetratricopeptide (TPR) repeat protein